MEGLGVGADGGGPACYLRCAQTPSFPGHEALSIRPDLLSPRAMVELQKLCDKAGGFIPEKRCPVVMPAAHRFGATLFQCCATLR